MWVRVTCPNGHVLRIESKFIGRSNQCPKCKASIAVWIKVTCPNGHALKVKSKFCGKQGVCPECKAAVEVPDLIELLAMESLGDAQIENRIEKPPLEDENEWNAPGQTIGANMRNCAACGAAVAKSYRTCPECGKYMLEGLSPADAAKQIGEFARCPACSNPVFPADEVCSLCGHDLDQNRA